MARAWTAPAPVSNDSGKVDEKAEAKRTESICELFWSENISTAAA